MNRQEIQQLLDMFLDGMTTVEQEQQLAEYFRSARDVPPEWEPFRRMFGWFDDGMRTKTPLSPLSTPLSPPSRGKLVALLSAAASIALLLCLTGIPQSPPKDDMPLRVKAVQAPCDAAPKEETTVASSNHQRHKPESSSLSVSKKHDALADAERIYNEQNHDMVDERYEDVRQAVSTQEVRSRGFFTAVDEQGNVQIIQCTNENTNQSNVVEL